MSHGSFAQHTRRQWLAGGGGLAAAMVMPPLLRGRELAGAAKAAPAKAAIVIYLQGGLSHYESFDPKPNAPTAYRGEFNPISTSVPGTHFAEHLPLLAARAHRFNVLRSVYVDSPSHPVAIHQTLTGWDLPGADVAGKNRNTTHPSIGAWVSRLRLENRRDLPPSRRAISACKQHSLRRVLINACRCSKRCRIRGPGRSRSPPAMSITARPSKCSRAMLRGKLLI